ncbi:hypothetical protein [uncultured Pseudomonas sp.]|tara:strand:+ start:104617 stop:104745 length:129 start_codon:yes stop_codon:yes gene_type:complete
MNLDPRDPEWDGPDEDEETDSDEDQDFDIPEPDLEYRDEREP